MKKDIIKELFFNHPTKQWHFEQIRQESGLSRAQTNEWLRKLRKNKLITRIKPKGKMPYYVANYQEPHYQNSKRLFALNMLHESGLLDYLVGLDNIQAVVMFGSFARWDWYDKSDIDLFIYGDTKDVHVGKFGSMLKREIQVFSSKNENDLKKMGVPLLKNIIKGIPLKGALPNEVLVHASV